jgi:hypothetical protein
MCDFHSVIVTGDGRILHSPCNSHSSIARANSLDFGLDAKWWECEWNGRGEMPVNIVQQRGKETAPTQAAYRAAESHYRKLAAIVAGDSDPSTVFPFCQLEYSDVREMYAKAAALKKVEPIAELFEGLDDQTAQAVIRELVETLSLDMTEIAAEEIETAIENDDTRYDAGYEAGMESACEDMYSWESVQEHVDEAVDKAKDELKDELAGSDDEARIEGYKAGFLAATSGATPAPEFINGLPGFLFR